MNPIRRTISAAKQFVMQFARSRGWYTWGYGRSQVDYAGQVGDGRGNAIVVACLLWMCRTLPESPLRAQTLTPDGWEYDDEQALSNLIRRPNPFYAGELLIWATLGDWAATGNAYWLKAKSASGRAVELWWVPSTLMEPCWPEDGSEFISHYEYSPNGAPERVETADVVHFRYGIDPKNIRKGLSPLASLAREIFTDDEAANFSASLLRNLGVPGVLIAPAEDVKISPDEADQIKGQFETRFSGDNRGRAMVMSRRTTATVVSFNPQQMDLKTLRRLPEERVSAVFGTPAVVVGLGAGLDRSTFSNFSEAREAAYESNIIPSQRLLAGDLNLQLTPDFGDPNKLRLVFDNSGVRVLQEDEDKIHTRAREDARAGLLTLNEARQKIGMDALEQGGDILYVPIGVTPTEPADLLLQPEPVTEILELPPGKMRVLPDRKAVKDAEALAGALQRLRNRLQPRADREIAKFLAGQLERVLKRVGAKASDDPMGSDELRRLKTALEAIHLRSLQGVHAVIEDALGVAFDLDDPTTREFLKDCGVNIASIHQTTLDAVRAAMQEGQAQGEGLSELAQRLRDLPAFNQARANTVARTELGTSTNLAAGHSYRASGVVVGVLVRDGDYDEACRAMDGRTFRLDNLPPPLQHPNCLRALLPLTDASQLEDAA